MKCPRCGLFSPDVALRCDCGYQFSAVSYATDVVSYRSVNRRAGAKNMVFGAGWCAFGVAATVFTVTSRAGLHLVFWGAVVCGITQFFRGVSQRWPRE